MESMFITPMQRLGSFEELQQVSQNKSTGQQGVSLFKSIFDNAIQDVKMTDNELVEQQFLLTTGQIDDPHAVPVAAAKAQMSVDLLVSMRTKALEAYNEMIRLSI